MRGKDVIMVSVDVQKRVIGKRWMNLAEVRNYTGLSDKQIAKLRETGNFRATLVGYRTYLYMLADIDKFLDSHVYNDQKPTTAYIRKD